MKTNECPYSLLQLRAQLSNYITHWSLTNSPTILNPDHTNHNQLYNHNLTKVDG